MTTHSAKEERLMFRYLLGAATDEECVRVEERFLRDAEYLEQMRALECEIIDDYLRGEMPAAERRSLERHALASPQGRALIARARKLQAQLDRAASEDRAAAEERDPAPSIAGRRENLWKKLRARLFTPAPVMQYGMAAAALLLLLGGLWLLRDTGLLRQRIERITAELELARRNEKFLQEQLAAQRGERQQLNSRLENEKISLPKLPLRLTGYIDVSRSTRNYTLNLNSTTISDMETTPIVRGTGAISLTGNLTVTNGACVQTTITITRVRNNNRLDLGTWAQQFCGSNGPQAVNISKDLDASLDDAKFEIKLRNADSWNKVDVTGNLRFSYPTGKQVLTPEPNIPADLNRGVDVDRTFALNPNTAGHLKVEIKWTGGASLHAKLLKPNGQVAAEPPSSTSGNITFNYDIQPGDITTSGDWTINVVNDSPNSVTAVGTTFKVIYTVKE